LQRSQTSKAELLRILTAPWNEAKSDDLASKVCRLLDATAVVSADAKDGDDVFN
jgi:hypothetical protein